MRVMLPDLEGNHMGKFVPDDDMRAKLGALSGVVEVCDPSGRTIGYFVPSDTYTRAVYDWAKTEVTDEELNRVRQETGGSTLADIKKRLGWS